MDNYMDEWSVIPLTIRTVKCEEKKKKKTTKCDKRVVTYDVEITQCEDKTIKCEKKSKGTIKCDKRTVTCNVGTTQYEDRIVKCEVLVT